MRPCTTALKTFLDGWNSSTQIQLADLYIFTLITGEQFFYSAFQTPLVAPFPNGAFGIASAPTPAGTNTLYLGLPLNGRIKPGVVILGTDPVGIIPTGSVVLDVGYTNGHIAISQDATGPGVLTGNLIEFGGVYALGPRFSRTKVKTQVGPQVDEMEVDIYVGESDFLGTSTGADIPWQEAFFLGLFDGAYCELIRAYISPYHPTVVGTITWFFGRIGDVDVGRTKIAVRVKSLLDLLTVQMPRRLFQSACNHVFGAPLCGFDRIEGRNAAGVAAPVGSSLNVYALAGSSQGSIVTDFVPPISGSFDNGTILGTAGLNSGYSRTIGKLDTSTSPGIVFFLKPFLFPVVAGTDIFKLIPGCDHTLDTCTNTFNNRARYGGFPFIPPPETAV